MRSITASQLANTVKDLFLEANFNMGDSMLDSLRKALKSEESPLGQNILKEITQNDELAQKDRIAICQDTGMSVIFVELGQEVQIIEGDYTQALNEGVQLAYQEGHLRKSVVKDPLFDRSNTQDNTPAVIHTTIVQGTSIKIEVMPKGFGSENMSTLKMFAPSVGIEGVKRFILETVEKAGPNACPPMIVGVGIGGTFEYAALLAKEAVLRGPNHPNHDPNYATLEKELLEEINQLGIGPSGLGGTTTALAINIEFYPTHIASIPIAINISCHASRHASKVI